MGVSSLSIQISTNNPSEALRRIGAGLSRLTKPAGVIGFASGTLANCLPNLAEGLRQRHPELPGLFAASDGVFTERGELENQDGLVCLLVSGSKLLVSLEKRARHAFFGTEDLDSPDAPSGIGPRPCPKMLLASGQAGLPDGGPYDGEFPPGLGWFGAVTSSDVPICGVDAAGQVQSGSIGLVEFPSLEAPLLVASPCCRLITAPLSVSWAEGNTVLELDGVPALVALGQASSKLVDRSWIVVALSENPDCIPTTNDGTPNLRFRPVRGIDPARGAILLNEPVGAGTKLAFAVRDDRSSRRSLEEALRATKPRLRGAAPRFGIYFDGLGRGRSLYGTPNVDLGLVRHALGEFPVVGMRTAFELRGDVPDVGTQTLTGQLALFRNPS